MENSLSQFNWYAFKGNSGSAMTLQSLCLFRSWTLFDGGKRKNFDKNEVNFGDVQYSDFESFHIAATDRNKLIGCIRVTPPNNRTVTLSVLGKTHYDKMLKEIEGDHSSTVEINRLVVDPSFRKLGLGKLLIAAAFGFIENRWDTKKIKIICCSGNIDHQTTYIKKVTDYSDIKGFEKIWSDVFNDYVSVMVHPAPPYKNNLETITLFTQYFSTNRVPDINFTNDFYTETAVEKSRINT